MLPLTVYMFSFWENQRAEQNQSPDQAGVKYQESLTVFVIAESGEEKMLEEVKREGQPKPVSPAVGKKAEWTGGRAGGCVGPSGRADS